MSAALQKYAVAYRKCRAFRTLRNRARLGSGPLAVHDHEILRRDDAQAILVSPPDHRPFVAMVQMTGLADHCRSKGSGALVHGSRPEPGALQTRRYRRSTTGCIVKDPFSFTRPAGRCPRSPAPDGVDVNIFRTVNDNFGDQPPGFSFTQAFTVETLNITGSAQAPDRRHSAPAFPIRTAAAGTSRRECCPTSRTIG